MSDPQMHGRSVDEKLCRQFESAWAEGRPESIERFLPAEDDPAFLATLEEMVCIELELRWKSWALARREAKELSPDQTPPVEETIAGPLSVETYLRRFPPLDRPEIIVRLAKHECFVRQQFGQTPSGDEYRNRFPDLSVVDEEFESGIPMMSQRSLDGEPPEAVMPGMSHDSVGDGLDETLPNARLGASSGPDLALGRFGNYELLEEIGRGGMGVVYRARQITADRIVGLKVIRRDRFQALPRDSKSTALDRFRHEAQAAAKQ